MAPEFVVYEYNPYCLPPKLLQAIGLVITCSVQTESIVEDAIGEVLKLPALKAKILTTHMSMQLRTGSLRSAARARWGDSDHYTELDKIVARIERAVDERNKLAHLTYFTHPETNELFSTKYRARKGLVMDKSPVSVEGVEKIAAEIYAAGIALVVFLTDRDMLLGNE